MLDVLIKLDFFRKLILTSVNSYSDITRSFCPVQSLGMLTFFASYNRCKKLELGSVTESHDLVAHLINRLSSYLSSAVRTVRYTYSCIQQSEMIVYLGNRSHSRSGILVSGLLVNRDCRRKSFDSLDIRLIHLSQKHSCVR